MHKPVKVLETQDSKDSYDEDKFVKKYMEKHGIDNVRGGSYVTKTLDDSTYHYLQKEIWSAKNCCTNCGSNSHFVKDCTYESEYESDVEWGCDKCGKCFKTENMCLAHERSCMIKSVECFRCGHKGHYSSQCYARKTIDGEDLDDSDEEDDDEGDDDDGY